MKLFLGIIIGLFFLLRPATTKIRSLLPPDAKGQFFNLEVSDTKEFLLPLSFDYDAAAIRPTLTQLQTGDFAKDIGFANQNKAFKVVSTVHVFLEKISGTLNNCNVSLVLENNFISDPIHCQNLRNSDFAAFQFKRPIVSKIYLAKFEFTNTSDSVQVHLRSVQMADGKKYVEGFSRPKVSRFLALWDWAVRKPVLVSVYLLIILLIIAVGFFQLWSPLLSLCLVAVLFFAGNALITPPYSGYDETAHVTMFFLSTYLKSSVEPDYYTAKFVTFNDQANQEFSDYDFFRLHDIERKFVTQCPHEMPLAPCGVTERPRRLYDFYVSLLRSVVSFDSWPPVYFMYLTRGIHLFLLGIFLLLIFHYMGPVAAGGITILMTHCGAFISQMPSVTKNIYMYFYGFLILPILLNCITNKRKYSWELVLLVVIPAVGYRFDVGASIGLMVGFLCLILNFKDFYFRENIPYSRLRSLNFLLYLLTVWFGCIYFAKFTFRFLPKILGERWQEFLANTPQAVFLDFGTLSTKNSWKALGIFLKSSFGSFLWGHEFYGTSSYVLLSGVFIGLSWLGFKVVYNECTTSKSRGKLFAAAAFTGIYLSIVLAIGTRYFNEAPVVRDSYLKLRFTAAGVALIYLLFYAGVQNVLADKRVAIDILKVQTVWVLILLLYHLPQFYLVGIY